MEIHKHNGKLITHMSRSELIKALVQSKIEIQKLRKRKAPLEHLVNKIIESIG